MLWEMALIYLTGQNVTTAVLGPLDGANQQKSRNFFVLLPDRGNIYLQNISVSL